MPKLNPLLHAVVQRRRETPASRALVVGISGIDGSGKSFVAARLGQSLADLAAGNRDRGYHLALIGVDGWLHLPHIRFAEKNCGEHFYQHALRLDELFNNLVLPLRNHRRVDLEMNFTEETATVHRKERYHFREVDIILLEGIFLFKRQYRGNFDLTCWIECSFETALARAAKRCQEGLPPQETVRAFERIYFPAQRIHFERDAPQAAADLILPNESDDLEDGCLASSGNPGHHIGPKISAPNAISSRDSPSQTKFL